MTTLSIDTPETQEAIERWRQGKINIFDDMARLERERDEAREALRTAVQERHDFHWELLDAVRERDEAITRRMETIMQCELYEQERDEARRSLEHITEYGTEEINVAVDLRQRLATALVERDEAREALKIKQ
jgi:hypothetical protein